MEDGSITIIKNSIEIFTRRTVAEIFILGTVSIRNETTNGHTSFLSCQANDLSLFKETCRTADDRMKPAGLV
jgi:hypothetical protein